MTTIVLMLLLAFAPAARAWQDGVLTEVTKQQADSSTDSSDLMDAHRMALNYVVYEFNVQTADRFYVADFGVGLIARGQPKATNPIDLDVHAQVKFAIEKQALYLKDKHGKEFKLGIVKQGLRKP
jgi:hypothetical protein